MKLLLATCSLLLAGPPVASQPAWELVWSDEFEGNTIDLGKWTHEVNAWGGGNNELQFYTARPQNSYVAGGLLTLEARKEWYTGVDERDGRTYTRQYTSARLNSRLKGDWLYGRIEVRAKMPRGQGLWPAIWMLPTDYEYGGWAASGEIDILEMRGSNPFEAVFSIHYGSPWPNNVYTSGYRATPDLSADFHTYAIEWREGQIRWYFDGEHVQTLTDWWSSGGPYPAPFDQRFHLLLNVAVGGDFLPNPPADAAYFPQMMQVDWVRVFQRGLQSHYGSAPTPLPGRLQAEHFDLGGQGFAYNDTTPENRGGAFRPDEAVDLELAGDAGGGANLGFVEPGEWIEYTLAAQPGNYAVRARVAAQNGPGQARLRFLAPEGAELESVPMNIPVTGGWQTWTTVALPDVALAQETVVARLEIVEGEFNLNWIDFELQPGRTPEQWMVY